MTLEALVDQASKLTPQQLTRVYLRYYDQRAEVKKQDAVLKTKLELIKGFLLNHMDTLGIDNFNTSDTNRVVFKEARTVYKAADIEMFTAYIIESGNLDLLQMRPSKEAVDAYKTETGALPPGIASDQIVSVGVRKSTKRRIK